MFKAEIGSVSSAACQVQGVWVPPDLRGRGLSAPGMAAVVEIARREIAPVVSLYVNDFNAAARATYRRVGFADCRHVHVGPLLMLERFRSSETTTFFRVLHRASPGLATLWWVLLLLRGTLPALLAVATGVLVGAVRDGAAWPARWPSSASSSCSAGPRRRCTRRSAPTSAAAAAVAQRPADGRRATRRRAWGTSRAPSWPNDLTHGPRLRPRHHRAAAVHRDGLHRQRAGRAGRRACCRRRCCSRFAWWAPLVLLGVWGCDPLAAARERGLEGPQHRRGALGAAPRRRTRTGWRSTRPRRRSCGCSASSDWVVDRFAARRRRLYELQWQATRLRERSVAGCLARRPRRQRRSCSGRSPTRSPTAASSSARDHVFLQAAFGTSAIAFGGLSWALDGAAAPVAAVLRLRGRHGRRPARCADGDRGRPTAAAARDPLPRRDVRLPGERTAGARRLRPDDPGRHLAGHRRPERRRQDDAGQAALPPLRPAGRARSRSTASTCASSTSTAWRAAGHRGVPGLRPLRAAAARQRRARRRDRRGGRGRARPRQGADLAARRSTRSSPAGYEGGTDLSGGQWQRIALARALCAVRRGAGVVLLDEPTAQLDVRGEAEIFERVLAATRHCTTILISHRFSTVRRADRICVVEHGRVVELGTPRRADGARRPLPDDVRPPGVPVRRGRRARGGGGL